MRAIPAEFKNAIATPKEIEPLNMRLPKPRERDPRHGLTRSFLNEVCLPTEANDFNPPVKSYVLRRKGAKKGIRLINISSLDSYIAAHEEKSKPAPKSANKKNAAQREALAI